jgi:acetyl esterase/lipase
MKSFHSTSGISIALLCAILLVLVACFFLPVDARTQSQKRDLNSSVLTLWGARNPPGPIHTTGVERDVNKPTDKGVAGRRIIKLTDVSSPELHVFARDAGTRGDAAVVVCPGGGFSILAWDLEGTEVAQWLNSIGVTVGVLKYRVPTRNLETVWEAPVQDAQRAISLMRDLSDELGIDSKKIGALGFSAGAIAAGRAGLMRQRQYEATDAIDQNSCLPNFMILVYGGGLTDDTHQKLAPGLTIDQATPPTFMVHAIDDHVPLDTPLVLLKAMKAAEVSAELHVYDAGGHGYGLRPVDGVPVTKWPDRCGEWLDRHGWLQTAGAQVVGASE